MWRFKKTDEVKTRQGTLPNSSLKGPRTVKADQDSLKASLWSKLLSTMIWLPFSSIERRSKTMYPKNILQILKNKTATGTSSAPSCLMFGLYLVIYPRLLSLPRWGEDQQKRGMSFLPPKHISLVIPETWRATLNKKHQQWIDRMLFTQVGLRVDQSYLANSSNLICRIPLWKQKIVNVLIDGKLTYLKPTCQ